MTPSSNPFGTRSTWRVSAAVAAAIIGVSSASAAQESSTSEDLTEVVVTGSRIIREGMVSPTPVTSLTSDELMQANPQSVAQALALLPSMTASVTPKSGSRTTLGLGSFLNLRNLGTNRNLVLLDGRRVVPSNIAGNTDINLLPQGLISNVNVVTGGASAAYGSDAVAGVTNFVLNTRFEGFKADVNAGMSAHGSDGESYRVALAGGGSLMDGRLHLIGSFDWRHLQEAYYQNRDWADNHCALLGVPGVTPATMSPTNPRQTVRCGVTLSNASYGGAIIAGPLVTPTQGITFGPGGVPLPFVYGSLKSSTFQAGGTGTPVADSLNFSTPMDNKVAFGHASFDVTENVEAFAELILSRAEGDYPQTPPYFYAATPLTLYSGNPFIPASIQQRMTTLGVPSFALNIVPKSWGNIDLHSSYETWDASTGVKGKFGDTWNWDVHYEHGRSSFYLEYPNQISWSNLYRAVDAVVAPNGSIVCQSAVANPAAYGNCVPLNPLGEGAPSRAALDYIHGGTTDWNENVMVQDDVAANISGEPISLWAGPVSVGAGFEWRKLQGSATSDPVSYSPVDFTGIRGVPASLQGKIGGWSTNNLIPTKGSYTVKEAFVETLVPLAKDTFLADSLDLNAAYRVTDYSQSGTVDTWKLGITWRPFDDLLIRATRSRDIRAPGIGDLYTKDSIGPNTTVTDRVLPGAPMVSVPIILAGNAALSPEEADTTTFGLTYQPGWLTGFGVSVDYYDIQIKDALATISTQETVNRCALGQQQFCDNLVRVGGNLTAIRQPTFNLNEARTKGVDLDMSYRTNVMGLNSTFRLLGTRLLEQSTTVPSTTGNTYIDRVGDASLGYPKWIVSATASAQAGPFGFNVIARYIDGGAYNTTYLPGDIDPQFEDVASMITFDVGASYQLSGARGVPEFYMNIANVLDRNPPLFPSSALIGTQTNSSLYDTYGRYYTAGVRLKF